MSKELNINGYTVIASLQAWQEWTVELDENNRPRLHWCLNQQDDVSGNKIEEWTFEGGFISTGDYNFETFDECVKFIKGLDPVKEDK